MLIFVIGAHWTILQSVAWVGMVVDYSRAAPLTEALSKTFDGKHPCRLCKLVKAGKAAEQNQHVQKPVTKIDFFLQSQQSPLSPAPSFSQPASREPFSPQRLETPPSPPPRHLLA